MCTDNIVCGLGGFCDDSQENFDLTDDLGDACDDDDDDDGLPDSVETNTGIFLSPTNTGTDPLNPDTDGDGFSDGIEILVGTDPNNGGEVPADSDSDGVPDQLDNCLRDANTSQIDTDGDGCGNRCDSDYDQSGVVGPADLGKFSGVTCFNSPGGTVPPADPVCDCDGSGTISAVDVACFSTNFNRPAEQFTGGVCASTGCPGPSAFPGAACFR